MYFISSYCIPTIIDPESHRCCEKTSEGLGKRVSQKLNERHVSHQEEHEADGWIHIAATDTCSHMDRYSEGQSPG